MAESTVGRIIARMERLLEAVPDRAMLSIATFLVSQYPIIAIVAERNASRERQARYRAHHSNGHVTDSVTDSVTDKGGATGGLDLDSKAVDSTAVDSPKSKNLKAKTQQETTERLISHRDNAKVILAFLNQKSGRNFQETEPNLGLIIARLKSGATVVQCRAIIARKVSEWKTDEKMAHYLRPATLFNATKFEQYRGELPATAFTHVEPVDEEGDEP